MTDGLVNKVGIPARINEIKYLTFSEIAYTSLEWNSFEMSEFFLDWKKVNISKVDRHCGGQAGL